MRCTSPDTHHTPVARCGYVRAAPPSPLAPSWPPCATSRRPLSLYSGNCRVFCARVRREVSLPTPGRHTHSLTHPGGTGPAARSRGSTTLTSRGPRGKRRRPRQTRGSPCPCCTLARSPPSTRQSRSPFAGRAFWGAVAREGLGLAPTPVQRRGLKRRGPAPEPLRLSRAARAAVYVT